MDDLVEALLAELLDEKRAYLELAGLRADVREELAPLVRAALDLRTALRPKIPDAARARIEQRILASREAALLNRPARNKVRESRPRVLHLRFAALSVLLFALLFSSVATYASAGALPGSALYGVKRASEAVWLWLTPRDNRGSVHLELADRRLKEFEVLLDQGTFDQETLEEMGRHVDDALALAETLPAALAEPLLEEIMAVGARQADELARLLAKVPDSSRPQLLAAIRAHRGRVDIAAAWFKLVTSGGWQPRASGGTRPVATPTSPSAAGATSTRTSTEMTAATGTGVTTLPGTATSSAATAVPAANDATATKEAGTQEPEERPEPTDTPVETLVPEATKTPRATDTAVPTETRKPTKTPKPTITPQPTNTHRPTARPTNTHRPPADSDPTDVPDPTKVLEPTEVPEPTAVPEPTDEPKPTKTPKPDK